MVVFLVIFLFVLANVDAKQAHIVVVLVDDLGYYDTGLTNPHAITPTLSTLATEGVFLNQSYVQSVCSPSRGALLSGIYPFKTGMQNGVIFTSQAKCLNTSIPLLPEILRDLGYRTHALGKWHLGYCSAKCTPLERGFDSYMGLYNGMFDHVTHVRGIEDDNRTYTGIDLHINERGDNSTYGIHSTDIFSDRAAKIIRGHNKSDPLFLWVAYPAVHVPLKAPRKYKEMYPHVEDHHRRGLLAMASHVDDGVRRIVDALMERDMVENTLLVFLSDNGGEASGGGYNYPLRGTKNSLWEGGMRSQTLLWGGLLNKVNYTNDGLMHAVDWLPTFVNMAGGDTSLLNIDGVDNTEMIINGAQSKRREMVYQINELKNPIEAAIRSGPFKLIMGHPGDGNWYIPPEMNYNEPQKGVIAVTPNPNRSFYFPKDWDRYLFNVKEDPEERSNLINELPDVAEELERLLAVYDEDRIDAVNPPNTPQLADPHRFGGFWSSGWCEM